MYVNLQGIDRKEFLKQETKKVIVSLETDMKRIFWTKRGVGDPGSDGEGKED